MSERQDFSAVSAKIQRAFDTSSSAANREQSHVRAVQAQIEAIGRGDMDAALANAAPTVQLDIFAPPEFDWIRCAIGIEAVRNAIVHNFGTVIDQRPDVQTVVAQADTVVLMGREQGRIRASGVAYDMNFVHRFTFHEGRLVSVRILAASTQP